MFNSIFTRVNLTCNDDLHRISLEDVFIDLATAKILSVLLEVNFCY